MDKSDLKMFLVAACLLAGFLAAMFVIINALSLGMEAWKFSNMQKLGYEAQLVNMTCYAKYQGRWLECDVVTKNQFQIVK